MAESTSHTTAIRKVNQSHRTTLKSFQFEIAPEEYEIKGQWDDAEFYCFMLSINGKKGWRLPTIQELAQIRKSRTKLQLQKEMYWTSESYNHRDGNYAWGLIFNQGPGYWRPEYYRKSMSSTIRPVRTIK
jgi:hypothetical protein